VTLRADHPGARLQMMGQLRWQDICVTPCNVPVWATGLYRIGGGSIRPSETFNMPRRSGQVQIDAEVGSTVKHWVGFGLTLGGAGAALLGILEYMTAPTYDPNNYPYTSSTADSQRTGGIVFIIAGLTLLAVGIPLSMSATTIDVR